MQSYTMKDIILTYLMTIKKELRLCYIDKKRRKKLFYALERHFIHEEIKL